MPMAVVSMTTIRARTAHLAGVIQRILDGTRPPDRFLLHISPEPAGLDEGIRPADLPPVVRAMADAGRIEIVSVANTGPYRKLLPVLERGLPDDACVVTADDDVAYPTGWLAALLEAASAHDGIVAYRGRTMQPEGDGLAPYNDWRFTPSGGEGMMILPTGRGGILYRRPMFPDLDLLRSLRELAPHQDDVAFRFATLAAGVPVRIVDYRCAGDDKPEFDGFSYPHSLYVRNVLAHDGRNANDMAVQRILSRLGPQVLATRAGAARIVA